WNSPIYGFFKPIPKIVDVGGRRVHIFECGAKGCKCNKKFINRFLNTADATSTGNMFRHARVCWGEEAVNHTIKNRMTPGEVRQHFVKNASENGDITTFFERKGKGPVTYSHRQHTRTESYRPFNIVNDERLRSLLKTGRPGYWIPSATTVARDVKTLFARSRNRLSHMLRNYDGQLSISTDCWTSPNGHPFVGILVHFVHNGDPISLVLDVIEVPKVR
ncbi:uncharacterized protein BXZ73DRAFT_2163, partial [Epithele typhae]|uniref:uncharacterized protein n=1 Tax=Epithele typhae TaxID=378194 RepID=UPI0020082949